MKQLMKRLNEILHARREQRLRVEAITHAHGCNPRHAELIYKYLANRGNIRLRRKALHASNYHVGYAEVVYQYVTGNVARSVDLYDTERDKDRHREAKRREWPKK